MQAALQFWAVSSLCPTSHHAANLAAHAGDGCLDEGWLVRERTGGEPRAAGIPTSDSVREARFLKAGTAAVSHEGRRSVSVGGVMSTLRERLPCGRLRGVGVAGAALGERTSGSAQQQAEGKQNSYHSSHCYPPFPHDSFHR